MTLCLNIIILVFEILYYSLFMKFVRKEGKLWRYILMFSIITIAGVFIGTGNTISYLFLIFTMLLCLKYIVRIKTTLYDCFIIVIMILFGVLIQLPCYIILNKLIDDLYVMMTIYQIIKLCVLVIVRNKLYNILYLFKSKWVSNDFYIRYIFSILLFLYVITSCIFIITLLL